MRSHYTEDQLRVLEKPEITCEDFVALLGEYADSDLPVSLQSRLDDHAEHCSHCQQFKQSYLRTVELAAELRDKPVTVDIQNRLRAALNQRLGIHLPPVE